MTSRENDLLYFIVLSNMMLFECLFRPARSLFISYVHEQDHLGFRMLTVETAVVAVFDCIC